MKLKHTNEDLSPVASSIIEILGNNRLIVDGCKCVIDYTEGKIELALEDTGMRVTGTELVMQSFAGGQGVITGMIAGVEFFGL